MEIIKGYQFNITKQIYLISPKNKFWSVSINQSQVLYRAGVLRDKKEFKIIDVTRKYDSDSLARGKIITKIADKINKGYYSTTAKKIQTEPKEQKKIITRNKKQKEQKVQQTCEETIQTKKTRKKKGGKVQSNSQIKQAYKTLWKGFEKGDEVIELKLVGNELRTTRRCKGEESTQTKMYASYDKAVNFVHRKQNELAKQGFKPCISQAFLEQKQIEILKINVPEPLKKDHSLITMTDDAIEQNSHLKKDQGENVYLNNPNLGPPIDYCIKCLLAQNYKEDTDPTGWIMSEKLDGVRCLWTGTQMFSRNGNKFNFPNFFTKNWPKSQLDGELFIGRGKFSQTLSAVKKNVPIDSEWQNLKYLVFDAPGLTDHFKRRIKILQEELGKVDNPYIKCHAHRPCQGFADLFAELDNVNKVGGQGIMLRQPDAYYQNKRSKSLQKVKTFHDDQAEIIGYTEGTGRCKGWVGSLRVRNGKGIEFQVGSGLNDQLRKNPPQIGTMITYKYQEFNKQSGKPRFPTFLRVYKPI